MSIGKIGCFYNYGFLSTGEECTDQNIHLRNIEGVGSAYYSGSHPMDRDANYAVHLRLENCDVMILSSYYGNVI